MSSPSTCLCHLERHSPVTIEGRRFLRCEGCGRATAMPSTATMDGERRRQERGRANTGRLPAVAARPFPGWRCDPAHCRCADEPHRAEMRDGVRVNVCVACGTAHPTGPGAAVVDRAKFDAGLAQFAPRRDRPLLRLWRWVFGGRP